MNRRLKAVMFLPLGVLLLAAGLPLVLFSFVNLFYYIKAALSGDIGTSKELVIFPLLLASLWLLKLGGEALFLSWKYWRLPGYSVEGPDADGWRGDGAGTTDHTRKIRWVRLP